MSMVFSGSLAKKEYYTHFSYFLITQITEQ